MLHQRLDVAVHRELRRHHHDQQRIGSDQCRAFEQHRNAARRARVLAGQRGQQAPQRQHHHQGHKADAAKRGAPAQCLTHDAPQRNPQHHGQRRPGGQQSERLRLLADRCHTHRQRGGDRPEHRMRQRDADAADQQSRIAPGHGRQRMADDKQNEHAHQQAPPLERAGRQHGGQRSKRHHPGVDGEHQPDLLGAHAKAAADVAE
ncbi:hypothetical protein SDC9_159819 [bioreactor metagenome]|uniref:Uncharacterized protein n=1 Tax=bioreactor metagenome TaxID=1076179 RepID=A0A645FDP4_9ZZZZ